MRRALDAVDHFAQGELNARREGKISPLRSLSLNEYSGIILFIFLAAHRARRALALFCLPMVMGRAQTLIRSTRGDRCRVTPPPPPLMYIFRPRLNIISN